MFENFIVGFIAPYIAKIPDLDLSNVFSQPGVSTFIDFLDAASYFFPWNTVCNVVSLIIAIYTIRIIVAFFKMLWGVLPVV